MDVESVAQILKDQLLSSTQRRGECLEWRGFCGWTGQPRVFLINRWFNARNLFWIVFVGPIPRLQKINNSCANILCVDPRHLVAVEEKVLDPTKRVRLPADNKTKPVLQTKTRTASSSAGKLSPEQSLVQELLVLGDNPPKGAPSTLAGKYGITPSMVSQIRKQMRESNMYQQEVNVESIPESRGSSIGNPEGPIQEPEINLTEYTEHTGGDND
jgi:hypothetical protein